MELKISLIITTKAESKTLGALLESIAKQTRRVDEVIIANAGSHSSLRALIQKSALPIQLLELQEDANRAVGRNRAIESAAHEHILITDAGCILKEDWVAQMLRGFERVDVVAGFYRSDARTVFEKCVAPYALVMPDKIDTKTFLPATRSMGITKKVWESVGKFNEQYRYSEDYEFGRRIQSKKIPITVVPEAIVYWRPRRNLPSFARMIYEHAYGDGYSGTFRPKVMTIYLRYFIFLLFGIWNLEFGIFILALYFTYTVRKNYSYIRHWKALYILPVLQLVSDLAVMLGSFNGRSASHLQ